MRQAMGIAVAGICALAVAGGSWAAKAESPEISRILRQIEGGTLPEQIAAVEELGRLRERAVLEEFGVVEKLVGFFESSARHPRLRVAAFGALVDLTINVTSSYRGQYQQRALAQVGNRKTHAAVRIAIAKGLGQVHKQDDVLTRPVVTALSAIASDHEENQGLRLVCCEALGHIGHQAALNTLVELLKDRDPAIRVAAGGALMEMILGDIPDGLVISLNLVVADPKAEMALRGDLALVLAAYLRSGGKYAKQDIIRNITAALSKTDPQREEEKEFVLKLVRALGRVADPATVPALKKAYQDFPGQTGEEIRAEVCHALGEYFAAHAARPDGSVAKELVAVLRVALNTKAESPRVQEAAAFTLGNMCYPTYDRGEAADQLIIALKDAKLPKDVARAAARSLHFLTGQDFGEDGAKWDEWFQKNKEKLRAGQQ